jgi:RimJ/RimL family protein N-acetyltransferase
MYKYICLEDKIRTCKSYKLDSILESQLEQIRRWRNAQLNVLRQSTPITERQQISYFSEVVEKTCRQKQPEVLLLGLYCLDLFIGYGGLVNISWLNRTAEISFLVDTSRTVNSSSYEGDFFGFLSLIAPLAFEELHLARLFTETYQNRGHHISILEKYGFIREGVLRRSVVINGRRLDSMIHGLLRDEWTS